VHSHLCNRLSDLYWYVLYDYFSTCCKLSSWINLNNI
jgi:hypothetical protein